MGPTFLALSLPFNLILLTGHKLPNNVQYGNIYRCREESRLVGVGQEVFNKLIRLPNDDVIHSGLAHAQVPKVAQKKATQSLPRQPVPEDDSCGEKINRYWYRIIRGSNVASVSHTKDCSETKYFDLSVCIELNIFNYCCEGNSKKGGSCVPAVALCIHTHAE